jgi:predicted HTH domain antitoxin
MSNVFTITYPEQIPDLLLETREQFETEARKAMAVKLFEMKRLSSGMAAMLAGMERKQFLLSLHLYGVPMINLEENEFFDDIQNA